MTAVMQSRSKAWLACFLILLVFLGAPEASAGNESAGGLRGIDVSHYDGAVDWRQVKAAGFVFAFAKSSDGTGFVDPMFATNWKGMKAAGLIRGAYDFYRVGEDPLAQAKNVAKRVKLEPGDLPIVVDIETMNKTAEANGRIRTALATFVKALEDHFGVKPIIYTSPGFWNEHVGGGFTEYPLWVAEYGVSKPKEVVGWDKWTFWQTSKAGHVDAINGHVDLDYFAGTMVELNELTKR